MSQTAHNIDMPAQRAGMGADSGPKDVVTGLCEPTAGIAAGLLVVRGTAGLQMKPPAAATDVAGGVAQGVVLYDASKQPGTNAAKNEYDEKEAMPVMRKGRVWCKAEGTITIDTQCFVRFADGAGGTEEGAFRADADTATAAALEGAVFRSTKKTVVVGGTTYNVALVELNLPVTPV